MAQKLPGKNHKISFPITTRNSGRENFAFQNYLKWPKKVLRPKLLAFYDTRDLKKCKTELCLKCKILLKSCEIADPTHCC